MIVLQSPVRFGALPLTRYERERSQNCWPFARPRAIKLFLLSFYGTRHARDFVYQALPLFSMQHWKVGLGMRLLWLLDTFKCPSFKSNAGEYENIKEIMFLFLYIVYVHM